MHEKMINKMNGKPLVSEHLRAHLLIVTIGRRLFVLTSDYSGPNLLTKGRKGNCQISGIKSLNLLLARISETFGSLDINWKVDSALKMVDEQKIERQAHITS